MKNRILALILLFSSHLFAADVTWAWNALPAQTGVVITKFNVYVVTAAGTETTNGPATFSTPVVPTGSTDTSFTALNVAPGIYFAKISSFGTVNGVAKESLLSNETAYVVPPAIIVMGVPVQLPVQVVTH